MDVINLCVASVIAIIGIPLSILVAIQTRLKLDPAAIVVSLGYLVSFALRLVYTTAFDEILILNSTAFIIVWGCMYYFVFEMKRLHDVLKSDDP